ncbi:MAG: prepilin-type N-terminal cleavage/methylation domain-containing protein [Planctomycetota bacterium]
MRGPRHTNVRGFTLLETVLAIAVGSLVLGAALGVLTTVRTTNAALEKQSRDMNELARVQLAVRDALDSLHTAPPRTVRAAMVDASEEQVDAVLNTAFPEPIAGLAPRFEMTTGTNPRLEVVLSRPLLDRPRPVTAAQASGDAASLAVVSAEQLPGHRGAFELRRDPEEAFPSLWWVPMVPRDVPMGVVFDERSLPPPRRLCRAVRGLTWTAFIDSRRVPLVRAIEKVQLPAYVELEIETAGGGYANWMFELGWTIGPELEAPPSETPTPDGEGGGGAGGGDGEEQPNEFENESGNPGIFNPDELRFEPEDRG